LYLLAQAKEIIARVDQFTKRGESNMRYRAGWDLLSGVAIILTIGALWPAGAQAAGPQDAAVRAVRSFYTFHLARNKDFKPANVRLRRRFLTPELYQLLLDELKREEARSKTQPDEAPYFEGDPLTDSQEYPDSFRMGKADMSGDRAKVTVTMVWSAKTSRGRDQRDIVVEVAKSGAAWLIDDIISSDGSRLQDQLKREH
jgi:uncharacterized protein DUF3828